MEYVLALSDAGAGGKARSVHRLAAAGLPVPTGFALGDRVFRSLLAPGFTPPTRIDVAALGALDAARAHILGTQLPMACAEELARALRVVRGERFSVRSSFADEDVPAVGRPPAAAQGIYESRIDVAAADLDVAIREVLASALAPGAVAYALSHGRAPAADPVSVLIHEFVAGDSQGLAAMVATGGGAERAGVVIDVERGEISVKARALIVAGITRLASLRGGGVEVEWVARGSEVIFVQERAYHAPSPARAWHGLAEIAALATNDGEASAWRWDAEHNPEPLSPVQAGLVAHVDEHCRVGFRQRVVGGYLFVRTQAVAAPTPMAGAPDELLAAAVADFDARVGLLATPPPLSAALAIYGATYQTIFGAVQPAARRALQALAGWLVKADRKGMLPDLLAGIDSVATVRARLAAAMRLAPDEGARRVAVAAYAAGFGDEAAVWDVAGPTFREQPVSLPAVVANDAAVIVRRSDATIWTAVAEGVAGALPEIDRPAFHAALASARIAAAVGEADDALFARAQALIRRAVLALGHRWRESGGLDRADDVFFLPFAVVLAHADGVTLPADARQQMREARTADRAARRDPPPIPDREDRGRRLAPDSNMLRGHATAGRAIGRVVHHGAELTPGGTDVLVAATLLPTELPLLEAAALVVETGGPLGHVAVQARDRGLPAVVGATGATLRLAPGDLVLVDADRGLVIRL